MSKIGNKHHLNHALAALVMAAALSSWSGVAFAAHAGPFRPFLGSWRGAGEITSSNGEREPLTCRAAYDSEDEDQSLTQTLVCASDSFRINVVSNVTLNGTSLQGQWRETTRDVQGDLSGELTRGDFEGTVSGGGFNVQISIRSNGRRQVVHIQPSAGDIQSVDISLNRQK